MRKRKARARNFRFFNKYTYTIAQLLHSDLEAYLLFWKTFTALPLEVSNWRVEKKVWF